MTQKLKPYALPNGVEAALKPISPEILWNVQDANPPPPPPMEEVERPDGSKEMRANPASPEYREALQKHAGAMSFKLRDFIIKRGLVLRLTDEQKAEVATLRADLAELNIKLPDDDKVAYFVHIACDGDMKASMKIIADATKSTAVDDPKSEGGSDASPSDSPASP